MDQYFQQALSNMAMNAAYGDAIRHMYDKGYTVDEIHRRLDYPASIEKIEAVIADYKLKKSSGDLDYEYVQQQDKYGRKSFIRVKK